MPTSIRKATTARVARLDQHFKSPMTKLVMLFLEYTLESLCKFSAAFQSNLPMLPSLKAEVKCMHVTNLFGKIY